MNNNIYPCLWFGGNGNEAANFYCATFANTKIIASNSIVMMLEVEGQKLMLLNAGPQFQLNPSISQFVTCTTVDQANEYWNKLSAEGKELMPLDKYPWSDRYGWVQDKFGVNWQLFYSATHQSQQKITPAFMFTQQQNGRAKEAIEFYTSIFPNSNIQSINNYAEGEGDTVGNVKHARFSINKFDMIAMDSSYPHQFGFNEATSVVVNCDTQDEIDYYWNKLTHDGEESMCGWLKDKFGVSWQIVPSILGELMSDDEKGQRVMQAFMQMKKFDIATLLKA